MWYYYLIGDKYMNKTFTIYSKDPKWCGLELSESAIEVNIWLYAENEDEGSFEIENMHLEHNNMSIDFDQLSKEDQKQVNDIAQELADDNAYENYYENQMSRAEDMADAYEDR